MVFIVNQILPDENEWTMVSTWSTADEAIDDAKSRMKARGGVYSEWEVHTGNPVVALWYEDDNVSDDGFSVTEL
jgi:hypothetical protein